MTKRGSGFAEGSKAQTACSQFLFSLAWDALKPLGRKPQKQISDHSEREHGVAFSGSQCLIPDESVQDLQSLFAGSHQRKLANWQHHHQLVAMYSLNLRVRLLESTNPSAAFSLFRIRHIPTIWTPAVQFCR